MFQYMIKIMTPPSSLTQEETEAVLWWGKVKPVAPESRLGFRIAEGETAVQRTHMPLTSEQFLFQQAH